MRTVVSLLLLALPLSAAKVEVDVEPTLCESGVYRVVSPDTLSCAQVDRVEVLEAQRDFHERAQRLHKAQRDALQLGPEAEALAKIMVRAQDRAEEACRATGRAFDREKVQCGAALPAAKGEKR